MKMHEINETKNLQELLKLSQALNSSLELEEVLNIAIKSVVDFLGAERGFIMLFNDENTLEVKASKNVEPEEVKQMKGLSKTILDTAAIEGESILTFNAQIDPRFQSRDSVQLTGMRSVMCVPMKVKDKIIGVIYLDNRVTEGKFNETHLSMLEAFSNHSSIAIENAKLHENLIKSYEEKIRLARELHEQEKKRLASEEANRLKSEFVNLVSHELKSPLTVIKSYTSLLYSDFITGKNKIDNEMKTDIYETIENEVNRLINMIRKQLDASSIDAGKTFSIHLREHDINSIIDNVVKLQSRSGHFIKDSHVIEKEIQNDLPYLFCDGEKISQVLYNLLENALKYSPKGGKIKIKVHGDGKSMYFSISDNGIGISEEGQKKLFQKFSRPDRDAHRIHGTGLGLYLVKYIIELHGGTIGVNSKKGKGSEFYFNIPAKNSYN